MAAAAPSAFVFQRRASWDLGKIRRRQPACSLSVFDRQSFACSLAPFPHSEIVRRFDIPPYSRFLMCRIVHKRIGNDGLHPTANNEINKKLLALIWLYFDVFDVYLAFFPTYEARPFLLFLI